MQILSNLHTSVALFGERLPRLMGWAFVTLLLSFAVWWVAPQQLPVTAYKLSLVSLAGCIGYWLDRSLFPYARPDSFQTLTDAVLTDPDDIAQAGGAEVQIAVSGTQDLLFAAAMLRRAVIVGCAMLALGLGA